MKTTIALLTGLISVIGFVRAEDPKPALSKELAKETATIHYRSLLEGRIQDMEATYAPQVTLLPGHGFPEQGLAGAKDKNEAVTVERSALLKAIDAFYKGRPFLTPEQADGYLKRAAVEVLETKAGDPSGKPQVVAQARDGKPLAFTIKEGDVLVKIGNPTGHFTVFQMRSIASECRVVAESKP